MKKIVFFTGSGISAESGLPMYRTEEGLWNDERLYEVATSQAIQNDLDRVNHFFNNLRQMVKNAKPNIAHKMISQLQKDYDVTVLTQNIDDLHERAGVNKVLHLHGNIMETVTTGNSKLINRKEDDILPDEREPYTNGRLRPNVVLFDEVPHYLSEAKRIMDQADVVVVIGTSLQVHPVNQLVFAQSGEKDIFVIDPDENYIENNMLYGLNITRHIKETADIGMKYLERELKGLQARKSTL